MTVTLPDNSTLQYMVAHDSDNAVIKSLSSFTDTMGTVTNYSYTVENGSYYNAKSTSAPGTAPIQYVNLTTITHPTNAQTEFSYGEVTRNLGSHGLVEEYRLTSRRDLVNSNTYNTQTYTYSVNEYSGTPATRLAARSALPPTTARIPKSSTARIRLPGKRQARKTSGSTRNMSMTRLAARQRRQTGFLKTTAL